MSYHWSRFGDLHRGADPDVCEVCDLEEVNELARIAYSSRTAEAGTG
jgi:hypothetical protein